MFKGKKQKVLDARDEEKKMKKQMQQQMADRLASETADKEFELNLKRRKHMKASERFAMKPIVDSGTFKGKLKILKDV